MKRNILILTTLFILAIVFFARQFYLQSSAGWTVSEKTILAMGTVINIKAAHPDTKRKANAALKAIDRACDKIKYIEKLASVYDKNSEISKINTNAGITPVAISNDLYQIIKASQDISAISDGAFDISFAAFLKIWKLSENDKRIPSDDEITSDLVHVDYKKIILDDKAKTVFLPDKEMSIGLGGIAKGTGVDLAVAELRSCGFNNCLVDAGGDIFASGYKNPDTESPWIIGIKNPREGAEFIGKIKVSNMSVVTSGDYERKIDVNGKRYHHIFDPRTGRPADKSESATVIAQTAQYADALATAVFVLGADDGLKLISNVRDAECMIVSSDGKIYKSQGFESFLAK